jgi:hypothetical protein
MRIKTVLPTLLALFVATGLVSLVMTAPALAAGTWADEIANMVNFEKANSPSSNWDPYVKQVQKIRTGVDRGDQQVAKVETDRFMKMLQERAYGLNDVVADELYNFSQSVRPLDQTTPTANIELGVEHERPMSVPEHTIQTPYEGGPPCRSAAGCDYWLDDVYDPGAAG